MKMNGAERSAKRDENRELRIKVKNGSSKGPCVVRHEKKFC